MRLPLLDLEDQKSIDQEQVNRMVDAFLEAGFTYIDTAYPYHEGFSEVACRKALIRRHDRGRFLLADKLPKLRQPLPSAYRDPRPSETRGRGFRIGFLRLRCTPSSARIA